MKIYSYKKLLTCYAKNAKAQYQDLDRCSMNIVLINEPHPNNFCKK